MSTSINIISGLGIPSQIPLNPKENISSEASLKDLGLNNNLAFTYEKGLIVYCRLEGTRYEWREVLSGEELTGLRDTDFIYPDGTITDDVDYSNKKYNFFLVTTSPSEGIFIQGGDNITITGSGPISDPYIISTPSSPFEKINEGSGEGIIIKGRDSNNYGPIGGFAVDLSTNFLSSSTKGATGEFSFVTGSNNTASATGAVSLGINNTSSGQASFTSGNFNTASGLFAFSLGSNNISNKDYSFSLGTNIATSGNNSIGIGSYITSKSLLETVLGVFNTDYTPSSTTSWVSTDRLFTIGNGINSGSKSDALMILKNGLVTLPSMTNDLITDDLTGKVIITKEYLESLPSVTPDGSETKIEAGTNINIVGNGTILTPYIISSNNDDISQYTDEMAINAVATKFIDSDTISFIYDDEVPSIQANVNINSLTNSTGILKGGNLSIGSLTTLWTIQEGEGYIHNSLLNTTKKITWVTQSDLVATYLTTNIATYILINDLGGIVQQTTSPTQSQLRTHIYIGKLVHTTLTSILFTVTEPSRMFDIAGQIGDLNAAIGPINVGGGNVINHNGSNLTISATAGGTYRPGSNYSANRNSPSITSEPQVLAPTFRRKYRNGTGGWIAVNSTTIDPDRYDNNSGTLVTVPTGKYTVQVFWRFGGTGTIHVDYGQAYYDTLEQARASIGGAITIQDPDNVRDAVKRGWLIVKQNTNVLNNSTDAVFIQADKFGERGATGAIPSLQAAYKNSISPEIETDAILGAFSLKRGSTADTDNVFEIINGSGVITSTIKGTGALTALTYNGFNPTTDLRTINTTPPLLGGGNLTVDRTLSIQQATNLQNGYLSSIDWNIFNNKQNDLGYTPEDKSNKQNDFTIDGTGEKYPTLDLLNEVNDRLIIVENFNPPPTTGLTGQAYVVWSGTGLKYFGTWPNYYIEGVLKPFGNDDITLDSTSSMTPGQKRYDLIILDASGLNKITGVPDENPVLPTIDPDTQIIISNVLLNAGDTEPSDGSTTREQIYDENSEWTISKTGSFTYNANYATNPYKGSKSLLVNSFGSGSEELLFTASELKEITSFTYLCFRIKLLNFTNKDEIKIRFQKNTVAISSEVLLKKGNYNFTDNSSVYQLVIIPFSDFTFSDLEFNKLIFLKNTGNDRDFQLDDIFLTKGTSIATPSKQKAIVNILANNGIASATQEDDTITVVGSNGIETTASGKIITVSGKNLDTLWHKFAWANAGDVSISGTTATSSAGVFEEDMVGAKITIGTYDFIISSYSSASSVEVVSNPYGTVTGPNGSWGIYNKAVEITDTGYLNLYGTSSPVSASIYSEATMILPNLVTTIGSLIGILPNSIQLTSGVPIVWRSGNLATDSTRDVGIRRNADGVLEVFDGITAGQYRDMVVRNISGATATEPEHYVPLAQMEAALDLKVDKDGTKVLSDNNYSNGDKDKVSYITITQAVNLDDIETRVNDLDAAVVLKGTWDQTSGVFPGSGVAQAGWSYLVNGATETTIDGVKFNNGDRIIAVTDNASTSTYASNWYLADYTDKVNTVAGRTGNVIITSSDLSDFNSAVNALIATAISGKEDTSNKTDVMSGNTASSTKYLSAKGVYDWATGLFQTISGLTSAVLAVTLTGLSASSGTFTSADTLITAFNKIKYLIDNIASIYQTIAPNVQSVTSSTTVTPVSTNDEVIITAQAANLTLANPTGTFAEGQALIIRIKDNGTSRTITFGSNYRAIGITLPTATTISKTMYLAIIYNNTDSKWDVIGTRLEA